jgi:four helix bundle protein
MLKNFRAYQLAIRFFKACEVLRGHRHLKDQLIRSSSSIALNLAEGSEGASDQNRRRYYRMAMASLRESQAILDLLPFTEQLKQTQRLGNELGGYVFQLCRALDKKLAQGAEHSSPENGTTD